MIHKDKYGALGQIQADGSIEGGDSAVWTGHHVYLTNDEDKFDYVKFYEVSKGAYVRHPDPKMTNNGFGAYYKNPYNGCISRDQLTGILSGIIAKNDIGAMLRLMAHHLTRLFLFSYNTIHNGKKPEESKWKLPDLTLLDIWAMQLRGLGKLSIIFFPLLCVLDIHMLLNTLLVNREDDPDQINYAMKLIISREHVPTPISKLSLKLLNKEHLLKNIKAYWTGWRNTPGMYPLYEKRIQELK
jgi:hypothetical protein